MFKKTEIKLFLYRDHEFVHKNLKISKDTQR